MTRQTDGKSLYEQQEERILAQSDAFISLLTKRGILGDHQIDNEKVRKAKQEKNRKSYINFQKKHYNLGLHKDKSAAIRARRAAEARLHDPVILEYWDSLTEKRKKEFQDYLRSTNK